MQQWSLGGHSVRASAMGSIMKAAEDWGKMHVWGRIPVDTIHTCIIESACSHNRWGACHLLSCVSELLIGGEVHCLPEIGS